MCKEGKKLCTDSQSSKAVYHLNTLAVWLIYEGWSVLH